MYSSYISFVKTINETNIQNINFKTNSQYNEILEHVSYEDGTQYLILMILLKLMINMDLLN
jgi:hypothetical protein